MAQFLPNFRGDVSNPDFLAESLAANGDIGAYRSQPIAAFGDQTAAALVREGRADSVRGYLDRIAVGGYA
jgi:hypothetical protein